MAAYQPVSDMIQQLPVKKSPFQKVSLAKNARGKNFPPGNNAPQNGITRLKRFQSKRPTTYSDGKSVSSIERRESGGAFGLSLFCIFGLCLYMSVHIIYLFT